MTLPAYAVYFRGFPACPCLAEWLPVYEDALKHFGALAATEALRIYQLIGGAEASAGTHSEGGAFDITDLVGETDVWVARQMGADATWARTAAQGFTPHLHGVLTGCPHNGPAAYQIAAVRAAGNGLGRGGHGGSDDGPRPLSGRTWREGIEWFHTLQEEEMSWNEELTRWYPGDEDRNDKLKAGAQLNQARGYAQEAYRAARRADIRTERIEKALKVLAKGLGDEVEAAVRDALEDAVIDVNVNVSGGTDRD